MGAGRTAGVAAEAPRRAERRRSAPGGIQTRLPGELERLLGPVVSAAGVELEAVELAAAGRRRVLRVVVDRDGGVDLDAVAELSRRISEALDRSDLMGQLPYVLEVTSPGIDRPLTRPAQWRRARGRLVVAELVGGGHLEGRVLRCDDEGVLLSGSPPAEADARRVAYAEVARARVQVEFRGPAQPADPGAGDERERGR